METDRILGVPIFKARERGEIPSRKFKDNIHTLAHLGLSERAGLPGTSELIVFTIDEMDIVFKV